MYNYSVKRVFERTQKLIADPPVAPQFAGNRREAERRKVIPSIHCSTDADSPDDLNIIIEGRRTYDL